MTENFSTGDILQLHDTNCTKGAGTTMSTVLGISAVIIVIALFWNAYSRSRDTRANTEAIAAGTIGSLTSGLNGTQEEVRLLKSYERNDAMKIAYADGAMYGRPFHHGHGFYGYDGGCGYGGGFHGHGFGYGHGHGGCYDHRDRDCDQRQQFKEVRKFSEVSDDIEVINTCGSLGRC